MMKKFFVTLFLVAMVMISTTACSNPSDHNHAYAEITSSNGLATVKQSFNKDDGNYRSSLAAAMKYATEIYVEDSADIVTAHFFCETCGHDETLELPAPSSKVFRCDCKYEDEKKNHPEYLVINVIVKENEK